MLIQNSSADEQYYEHSKRLLGDARTRKLESQAREDYDNTTYYAPASGFTGYWGKVQDAAIAHVYLTAWRRRLARIARINPKPREINAKPNPS